MNTLAIVVTYNGLPWIDRCLGSLCGATGQVETVVIDNGSTDGTVEAIRQNWPLVELVRQERNLGFGQANNVGLRMALARDSSYALLLNQDAWITPGSLERLIHLAEQHPQYGILSPMHLNGTGDALDLTFSKYIAPDKCHGLYSDFSLNRVQDRIYPVEFVNAAAWLISRKCLTTVGGFSPSFFHYAEDDNYIARMRYHTLMVGVVPTAWVHHDREQRGENPYFADEKAFQVRKAALKYSDPASSGSPRSEIRALWSTIWRCLFSGQRAAFQVARKQMGILAALSTDDLLKHREASRVAGTTFL